MGAIGEGTIEDYGILDLIKAENNNVLELIKKAVGETGYDYWVSQDSDDNDVLNFAARRGSATSVQTFTIGSDTYINDYTRMRDDLYNYVYVLGPGASGSRIKSEVWADTLNFTYLDGAITSSDATITVDDTTDFPSSGYLWIGQEKVQYTGKTGTTFTGCTRGLLAQYPAYAHDDNMLVRDGNNSIESPEAGSSIDQNGVKYKRFERIDIASQNEADRWAMQIFDAHKNVFTIIELRVINHDIVCDIGDAVTVVDSDLGLSGDYKVVAIEQEYGYETQDGESTVITVDNKPTTFKEMWNSVSEQVSSYGSGETYGSGVGTNSVIFSGRYNCSDATGTAGLGCKVNFYVPNEFTSVDAVKMAYTIRQSRAAKTDANYNVTINGAAWGVSDLTIDIDDTDKTSDFEIKNGTLECTENAQMGDLWVTKGWFSGADINGGEWHSINLRPDANCHIEMDIEVIGTIVSPEIEYTGSVWVSGGHIFAGSARQNSLYMYDSAANEWIQKADMPRYLTHHAMCRAGDSLYVAGGSDDTPTVGTFFMQYDIASNTWTDLTSTDPLPAAREAGALIYNSGNGKLYYFMGDDGAGNRVLKVYEYDPSAASGSRWSTKTDFPTSAINQFGSWLYNGKVYITGGYQGSSTYSDRTYEYNISTDTWTRKADMLDAHGRARHAASEENGIGYVIGGWNNWTGVGLTTAEKYTHSSNSWAAGDALAAGAPDLGCAEAQDLLFIIWSDYSKAFKTYNPSTGDYTSVASYPVAVGGIHNSICSKY